MTYALDVASIIAVLCGLVHARLLSQKQIVFALPFVSGLCVAFIDGYAAWAHPEQRSFLLFAAAGLAQAWYSALGYYAVVSSK